MAEQATIRDYIDIAERARLIRQLVVLRERAGLSVEQVAERLEVEPEQVYAFEACVTDPHLSFCQGYARAVGVPLHVEIEGES